jgi:hypothetical protein
MNYNSKGHPSAEEYYDEDDFVDPLEYAYQ